MPADTSKERNWYKIATFVLAVATLTVSFISGVYLKRVDQRNQRVAAIEAKIQTVQERREKLKNTPRVAIQLLTISRSGLPETAFQSLKEVPAVIRIRHHGGLTVKGITVLVESSYPIIRLLTDVSTDHYETKLSDDGRLLTIDVPQLRPQSNIDLTVMCGGPTHFTATTRIAEGEVYEQPAEQKVNETMLATDSNSLEQLDPNALTTDIEIARELDNLTVLLKQEREQPLLIGDFGNTGSFILTSFGPLAVSLLVYVVFLYFRGRNANERGNRIGRVHSQNLLKAGNTKDEVRQLIGEPDRIILTSGDALTQEEWLYEPHYSRFFGWQPDVKLKFENDRVVFVEFKEYGERTYS